MCAGVKKTIRWSSALALIVQCAAATGNIITDSSLFDVAPATVTFSIANDGTPRRQPTTNDSNSPQADSQTVSLDKFDPSLGTLNSVTIELTSTYTDTPTIVSAINNGETTTDFFADGTLTLLLKGTGLIADQSPSTSPLVSAKCTLASGDTCSNQTATGPGSATAPGPFNATTSGLTLAPFIGTGQFDLTASISSALTPRTSPDNGSSFADNASMSGSLLSDWAGTVKVTYDFTPVAGTAPEPLTLYLLAGGLGAIALMRRRRR